MQKVNLTSLFQKFNELNVLIIGDVMVDAYYWGKVERISPEAPVPIVAVDYSEKRLGGAANVALNIQALGANAIMCAPIGNDTSGVDFIELLNTHQLSSEGILTIQNRVTTEKTRIIGNNYQMLRVDRETTDAIPKADEDAFFQVIHQILSLIHI